MRGKNNRDQPSDFLQRTQNAPERDLLINVRRSMQRQHCIVPVVEVQVLSHGRSFRPIEISQQRIDHDVADESNSLSRNSFSAQVRIGILRRREQKIGDLIRQQPIDLFRHRAIAAAQSRFDVRDFNAELRTYQRARDRRIDIANDDYPIRLLCFNDGFERLHDRRGLRGMTPRSDTEMDVRLGHFQIAKERIGHAGFVMLSSVKENRLKLSAASFHRRDNGCDFHEVGTRTSDVDDLEHC